MAGTSPEGVRAALAGASTTPYWLAAKFAEPEIMRALAAAHADTRLTIKDGTTPLMAALMTPQGPADRRERFKTEAQIAAAAATVDDKATFDKYCFIITVISSKQFRPCLCFLMELFSLPRGGNLNRCMPSCSFVSLVVKGVLRWRLGLKEIGEFPEREVRNSPVAVRLFTNDCSCYTHMVVKNRLKLCEYLFTAWVRLATPGPQPPQS